MKLTKKILIFLFIALINIILFACQNNNITTTPNITTNINNQTNDTTSSLLTTESTEASSTDSVIEVESIELVDNNKLFYSLNESFDKTSLEIKAYMTDSSTIIVNSEDLTIRSFDSSLSGKKSIYIVYERIILETVVYVLEDGSYFILLDF